MTRQNGAMGDSVDSGFYEDDEPLEDVLSAWQRGQKGLTGLRGNHGERLSPELSELFTPREPVIATAASVPLPANL
jgi:hypothetical protein